VRRRPCREINFLCLEEGWWVVLKKRMRMLTRRMDFIQNPLFTLLPHPSIPYPTAGPPLPYRSYTLRGLDS